jgi:CRISPR-associated protein Csy3
MKKNNAEKLKMASVLSFERKICSSDGLLFSGSWKNVNSVDCLWKKIPILQKSVRGTISNRIKKDKDLDAEVIKSNPQTIDFASLNFDEDTVKLSYSIKFIGGLKDVSSCNNQDCLQSINEKIISFEKNVGYSDLAKRYAYQILAARPLWRNRVGSECVKTFVKINNKNISIEVDSICLSLNDFDLSNKDVVLLANYIEEGLMGNSFIEIEVDSYSRIGNGQEVFPSQEMVLENSSKSKYLYGVNNFAALHSQKISNAIRTIDTWYADDPDVYFGPIPVEVYGSVTTMGVAYRKGKSSFYDLFDSWIIDDKELTTDEQKYVIAVLLRGGVFGKKDK